MRMTPEERAFIRLVNEQCTIAQACRWCGVDVADGRGTGKTWCPFGVTHPDTGAEAAFRLYDGNSAHCFACAKTWTPVSLMADYWDCTRSEAAEKIAELASITKPTWQDKWRAMHEPGQVDREALAEALKAWCQQVLGPQWSALQFSPQLAVPVSQCLGLLPLVTTEQEAESFLDGCKGILEPILRRQIDCPG